MSHAFRLAVIPDIHMRTRFLDAAVAYAERGWQVVFLGDYLDNGPVPNDPAFLRELLQFCASSGSIPLLGNHDVAYLYPDRHDLRVPGFEAGTAARVTAVFEEYRRLFRYALLVDRYLLSHAGLSRPLFRTLARRFETEAVAGVVAQLNLVHPPECLFRSRQNGGRDSFDGPLWLRPQDYTGALQREGITQLVGHSSDGTLRVRENLWMIDIDRPTLLEWDA